MGGNRNKPTPKKRPSKRKSSSQKRSSVKGPTADAEAEKRPDPEHAEKLSPRRQRQLESASSIRSRSLSVDKLELLHSARAVRSLKPANWRKWRLICKVNKATLGEVVALSLGHEPGQPDLMKVAEYCNRSELVKRSLYDSHRFPGTDFSQSPVDLAEFMVLAESVDWDIPPEMAALARRVSKEQMESQGRGEGPNVPDEPEADTGEPGLPRGIRRETLQDIQDAYDDLRRTSIRVSQQAVAHKCNRSRSTVVRYWSFIKKG